MVSTLLSFFTGNNIYKLACIALGSLLLACGLYAVSLHVRNTILQESLTKKESDIKALQNTLVKKRSEIELQNALIQANKADYETQLKEANEAKVQIRERYKVIYKTIDTYKGESNATSCDNARELINSVSW